MRGIIGAAIYSPSLRRQFAKSQAMLTNLGLARMFKAQPHDFPDEVDDLCFQVTGNCISMAMLDAASSAVCVLTLVWPLSHTHSTTAILRRTSPAFVRWPTCSRTLQSCVD